MEIECIATKRKLNITIRRYDPEYVHDPELKRKILPPEKSHYEALLRGKSAFEVRNKLADELMDPFDPEPPTLPSANALRIIKHRADAPDLDVVNALLELKKLHPNSINSIGLDPFFIHYSTELQRACYKVESSREKPTLSLDATGLGTIKFEFINVILYFY